MVSLIQASIVSILTFLVGLIVGHRFALFRDKRKEFNDAAAPIRFWAIELQKPKHFPAPKPQDFEIDTFLQHLSGRQRKAFNAFLQEYDVAVAKATKIDSINSTYYDDLSGLKSIGQKLMGITSRK